MARYEFIGRPPRIFTVVFVLAFVNACVSWIALAFHQFWAREISGGQFTYPIHYKGGQTWYFMPVVGRYIDWSFVGHFVALALLGLICYRHRNSLVRRASHNSASVSSESSAGERNKPLQPTSDDLRKNTE